MIDANYFKNLARKPLLNIEKLALLLVFLVFPVGQLIRVPIEKGDITIHLNDILIGIISGLFLLSRITQGNLKLIGKLKAPVFAFVIFAALSLVVNSIVLNPWQIMASSLYLIRFIAYALIYFAILSWLREKKVKSKDVIFLFILSILIIAFLGFCQYFFFPNLRFLTPKGWDPHYYRLVSTFLDPTFTGVILIAGLITVICQSWKNLKEKIYIKKIDPESLTSLLVIFFLYLALSFTYSRASYVMFLTAMTVIAYRFKSVGLFVVTIFVFIATIVLLPRPGGLGTQLEREDTVWSRINNWKETINIISKNPIFGVGFNAYRYKRGNPKETTDAQLGSHAGAGSDSSLLFVWATSGLGGFLSFLWLGKRTCELIARSKNQESVICQAFLVGLLVHSLFANSLFYPWVMEMFWVIGGLTEATIADT